MTISPQGYLDGMIRSRGYSTRRYKTLQSGYYNKPTVLQQQSYHVNLIELLRAGAFDKLNKIFASGISPNPCNQYGESFVHMICRRGELAPLQVLLQNGCTLQVTDDYGRTPLHDACWAARPAFDVVDAVLRFDIRLVYMTDCRGAVPFSYIRKEQWPEWNQFLESRKDVYWPVRNTSREEDPPPLTLVEPHSKPVPDPPNALTPSLANMVASGRMTPEEASFLRFDKDSSVDDSDEEDSSFDSDDDSESDDDSDGDGTDEDTDDDDDFSLDENEMADILNSIALPANKMVLW
jgi:hypothetical protein